MGAHGGLDHLGPPEPPYASSVTNSTRCVSWTPFAPGKSLVTHAPVRLAASAESTTSRPSRRRKSIRDFGSAAEIRSADWDPAGSLTTTAACERRAAGG